MEVSNNLFSFVAHIAIETTFYIEKPKLRHQGYYPLKYALHHIMGYYYRNIIRW